MQKQIFEFELSSPTDGESDPVKVTFVAHPQTGIDEELSLLEEQISTLDREIDDLTNQADKADYAIAAASGVIASLIDAFLIGKIDWTSVIDAGKEAVKKIPKQPSKQKSKTDGEKKGAADGFSASLFAKQLFGSKISAALHLGNERLEEFAQKPTALGLIASVGLQFVKFGLEVTQKGTLVFPKSKEDCKQFCKTKLPRILLVGLFSWVLNAVRYEQADESNDGVPPAIKELLSRLKESPKAMQVLQVVCAEIEDNWQSDEWSVVDVVKKTLSLFGVDKKFVESIVKMLKKVNVGEAKAVAKEVLKIVGKQSIPLAVNEILIRGFYFVSRLISELKSGKSIAAVDWAKTLPFKNRTIERMITVSTATFVIFDSVDAAVEGAIYSGGTWMGFLKEMAVRVNYVGQGRLVLTLGSEAVMEFRKSGVQKNKNAVQNEILYRYNAKMYREGVLIWEATKDVETSMASFNEALLSVLLQVEREFAEAKKVAEAVQEVDVTQIEKKNPQLLSRILQEMEGRNE